MNSTSKYDFIKSCMNVTELTRGTNEQLFFGPESILYNSLFDKTIYTIFIIILSTGHFSCKKCDTMLLFALVDEESPPQNTVAY